MIKKSYANGTSDKALLGETICQNLSNTVKLFPDREALISPYQNYHATYSEFWKEVEIAAKAFIAAGIKKGDRIGIWSPNRYEWVIVQYATARMGAILVTVNPAYRAEELKFALKQSEISLLVMSKNFRKTNYIKILDQVKDECPDLKRVVNLDIDWQQFLNESEDVTDQELQDRINELQFDDPINIQYTSGTTGYPKAATLTHHNILNNGYFIGERLEYTEKDKVCLPVPFYHCFGMVLGNLACTSHGAAIVISGEAFEPDTVLKTVQDEKCTSLYGVPIMFIAELESPNFDKFDLSSLRTGIMAGSQCPEKTMNEVREKMNMKDVGICYGMTETSPVSTQTLSSDPVDKRVSTVGRVHPHVEIKIINPETGRIVNRGEDGELCTRGYSVMQKYWNNPEATANIIDKNGWVHTGDIGSMDEEGFIKITGRIKDMILRGGENISPFEIEEYLSKHPAISDVYVIGVPDFKYGEEVMAWVKFREGQSIEEAELHEYCKGKIATYKIPKYWKFTNEFPTTVTGKIRKVEMRKISTEELGLHGRGDDKRMDS